MEVKHQINNHHILVKSLRCLRKIKVNFKLRMEAFKMTQIEAVQYPNLPLCDSFKGKSFFVRDCYDPYYGLIVDDLATTRKHTKIITVTGTPGIGKSVFYIYFFQRFKRENPNATIVTASFKNQKLLECFVYKPGVVAGKSTDRLPKWHEIAGALYLFDGAPEVPPPKVKMIAFASPNPTWFHTIFKFMEARTIFYMPCWKLDELKIANKLLDLNIPEEDLDARFNIFGGSARICFTPLSEPLAYEICRSDLDIKIESITTEEDLGSTLRSSNVRSTQYHSLFHFIPDDTCLRFQLTCCSGYVAEKISDNISKWDEKRRGRFISLMRGMREAGSLRGNLYESYVNQRLKSRTTLRIVSLNDMRNEFDLNMRNGIHMPCERKNEESIDGCWIVDNIIYFNQTTVSNIVAGRNTHPVNVIGIANFIIENLRDLKERILAGAIQLRLVFVIPEGLNDFVAQTIVPIDIVNEDDPVKSIHGIGRKLAEVLNQNHQITTVSQLRAQMESDPSQLHGSVVRAWNKFNEINAERLRWNFLNAIPQFVTEVREFDAIPW